MVEVADSTAVLFKPCGVRCRGAADGLSLEAALPILLGGPGWRLCYGLPRAESGLVLATASPEGGAPSSYTRVFACVVVGAAPPPPRFSVVGRAATDATTLTTLEATLDAAETFAGAVAPALRAANLAPAGARITGGYGRGSFVSLSEVSWTDDAGVRRDRRIAEPAKFQNLRDTLLKRSAKKDAAAAPPTPRTARPQRTALPSPPTSRLQTALRYLELAAECGTPPEVLYGHLVGKLALLDQAALKARDGGALWSRLAGQDASAADLLPIFAAWCAEFPPGGNRTY